MVLVFPQVLQHADAACNHLPSAWSYPAKVAAVAATSFCASGLAYLCAHQSTQEYTCDKTCSSLGCRINWQESSHSRPSRCDAAWFWLFWVQRAKSGDYGVKGHACQLLGKQRPSCRAIKMIFFGELYRPFSRNGVYGLRCNFYWRLSQIYSNIHKQYQRQWIGQ